VLEAAIAREAAVNPRLGAVVISMHEVGRARAKERIDGPLAGVPFLLKDLFQDYAGVLASSGCNAYRRAGYEPAQHSEIVRRWLAAGLVIFGRTNTPEFGSKGITEPDAWGATRNPWNLERTPGGSSGGSAAAVAAGIVPAAGANDGAGSIRIPAASTGLFGFKPGRGRTPSGPGIAEAIHGAAVHHVVTRSVRDSAVLLDATHGTELGAAYKLAPPERPYAEECAREPRRLRIAFSTRSMLGNEPDPAAEAALQRTVELLAGFGHDVEPAEPAIDGRQFMRDFLHVWFAQLTVHLDEARAAVGARDSDFELDSLSVEAIARARSGPEYAAAYVNWLKYGYQLGVFLNEYDVYMTPTLALPPPKVFAIRTPAWAQASTRALLPLGLGRLIPLAKGTIERTSFENLRGVPYTQLANIAGVPAMSVPLDHFADGLPLGIQFLADHGREGLLFSLAGQLERAAPWKDRRPPSLPL
jgi:amidase